MNFARTLIIKPSSLGDIVHALPVLTALKEAHPEARVSWLVFRQFAGLLEGHPRLDELLVFDRRRFYWNPAAWADFLRFRTRLRRGQFTAVLDLQGLFRSGVFARWSRAPDRVGLAHAREFASWFYTDKVSVPPDTHAVDRYLALARHVGLPEPKAKDHLPAPAETRAGIRARLADRGIGPQEPFVAACAYARWTTKQWPPERFVEVLKRVHAAVGARTVLVGDSGAVPLGRTIAAAAAAARPIDLTNQTTLKELVALLAEARAMVTNDSGPMHIAAAVGTPVVAVFGPTHPGRTGPYGPGHHVLTAPVSCRPCYDETCRYAGAPQALCCMTGVGIDEVAAHLLEAWRTAAAQ